MASFMFLLPICALCIFEEHCSQPGISNVPMLTMLQPTHAPRRLVYLQWSANLGNMMDMAFCLGPRTRLSMLLVDDGVGRFLVEGVARWPGGSVGCDPYTMARPLYSGLAQVWT